jgi:hypothetical protein
VPVRRGRIARLLSHGDREHVRAAVACRKRRRITGVVNGVLFISGDGRFLLPQRYFRCKSMLFE